MSDKPLPKGRGAAILAHLQRQKEKAQVGEAPATAAPPGPSTSEPQAPPVPRGRAALLHKYRQQISGPATTPPVVSSSASTPPKVVKEEVAAVEKILEDVHISEKEPVTFRGESGKPIKISSNYIRLNTQKNVGIYQYEVKITPDTDNKSRRIRVVKSVMRGQCFPFIFDDGYMLFLPMKLEDTTYSTVIPGRDGDQEYKVRVIYKKLLSYSSRESLLVFNILFKRIMYILLYKQLGRHFYDTEHRILIPQHKLEIYPGYAISILEEEAGLMICLDTRHHIIRTQTVYDLLLELQAADPGRIRELAHKHIIGSCILTKYNNKTYTVHDIAWDMTPKDSFPTRDGGKTTFIDYFKKQHDKVITDPDQPLLIYRKDIKASGSQKAEERMVCLIPEFSVLTNLSDEMRSDFKVMKDVAAHTRITPNHRMAALKTYLKKVRECSEAQKILNEWGVSIADGTIELHARQLENEMICFNNGSTVQANDNADWGRALGENKISGPVDISNWLLFFTDRDRKNAQMFAETIVRLGGPMGCRILPPKMIRLPDDRTDTYMNTCKENLNRNIEIVVFIVPSMRNDRYSVIKKICCSQIPVPSQVINSKTLCKQNVRSIIQKIALQMECKLGGTLWTVRFPFKNWMICGMDVYHGAGNKSVIGFVASTNESVSRWFSIATFQEKELSDFIKSSFIAALNEFKNLRGMFPAKVFITRDGVGDSQLDACRRYEVEQMLSVIQEFNLETTLCFVVVQKRINQRIFDTSRRELSNPPPGTIVDHGITRKYLPDFFLVPQSVRQGTVNPTHYIVLHNGCGLKPDQIQRLSYKLCHLYYNWPGTIRVPAPCQYAHKLASLVGQHIKKLPSKELANKLFYL